MFKHYNNDVKSTIILLFRFFDRGLDKERTLYSTIESQSVLINKTKVLLYLTLSSLPEVNKQYLIFFIEVGEIYIRNSGLISGFSKEPNFLRLMDHNQFKALPKMCKFLKFNCVACVNSRKMGYSPFHDIPP